MSGWRKPADYVEPALNLGQCPHCRRQNDRVLALDPASGISPEPGAASLCWQCGEWAIYGADLVLEKASIDVIEQIREQGGHPLARTEALLAQIRRDLQAAFRARQAQS